MKSEPNRTPTERPLVAKLKLALERPVREPRCPVSAAGVTPKRRNADGEPPPPERFPEALLEPMSQALNARDGMGAMLLLLEDESGYFGRWWNFYNQEPSAEYVQNMLEVPLIALARMVQAGEINTVSELQARIGQVLPMTGRKYRARSRTKANPQLGYGKPKRHDGETKTIPPLFVSASSIPVEGVSREARPDAATQESELRETVDRARPSIDPFELAVFDAVRAYRAVHGVRGAYPFVAGMLLTIGQGLPTVPGRRPASDAHKTKQQEAMRRRVRRIYFKVLHLLAERVTEAGYDVSVD